MVSEAEFFAGITGSANDLARLVHFEAPAFPSASSVIWR
jgi:hypothetical protein